MATSYSDLLKDPRWQKKRLEILERDQWRCRECDSSTKTLHVHHQFYIKGADPWDYENKTLITLCEDCHYEVDSVNWKRAFLELNLTPRQLLDIAIWHRFLLDKTAKDLRENGYDKAMNASLFYATPFLGEITEEELSEYHTTYQRKHFNEYTNG